MMRIVDRELATELDRKLIIIRKTSVDLWEKFDINFYI